MRPREITDADMARWSEFHPQRAILSTPAEVERGIPPCPAVITHAADEFEPVVRVAWELDELELADLARTGTVWLSAWGGLPVHMLEVQRPGGRQ